MANNWSGAPNGQIPLNKMVLLNPGLGVGGYLEPHAAQAWRNIQAAAVNAGIYLSFNEGYRDLATQIYYRNRYLAGTGYPAGIPGTSNHGYGLAIDINSPMTSWDTAAQRWWLANEAQYGWSSAQGRADNEPWHKVYVGSTDGALPAGGGATPIITRKKGKKLNFWSDTAGTIFYGNFPIPNMTWYNLLVRYDNSTVAKRDTFNAAERDMIRAALRANGMPG